MVIKKSILTFSEGKVRESQDSAFLNLFKTQYQSATYSKISEG